MSTAEERVIEKDITANAFFHDFLLFLQEARRDPFRLTEKGNLRLAEMGSVQNTCQNRSQATLWLTKPRKNNGLKTLDFRRENSVSRWIKE